MIFGLFNGTTVASVEKRIARLVSLRDAIHVIIDNAQADRAAAIREMQDELSRFAAARQTLSR